MKKVSFAAAAELVEKILLLLVRTGISKREDAKDGRGQMLLYLAEQIFHGGAGGDLILNNPDLGSLLWRQGQYMIRAVGMQFLKRKPGNIGAAG